MDLQHPSSGMEACKARQGPEAHILLPATYSLEHAVPSSPLLCASGAYLVLCPLRHSSLSVPTQPLLQPWHPFSPSLPLPCSAFIYCSIPAPFHGCGPDPAACLLCSSAPHLSDSISAASLTPCFFHLSSTHPFVPAVPFPLFLPPVVPILLLALSSPAAVMHPRNCSSSLTGGRQPSIHAHIHIHVVLAVRPAILATGACRLL